MAKKSLYTSIITEANLNKYLSSGYIFFHKTDYNHFKGKIASGFLEATSNQSNRIMGNSLAREVSQIQSIKKITKDGSQLVDLYGKLNDGRELTAAVETAIAKQFNEYQGNADLLNAIAEGVSKKQEFAGLLYSEKSFANGIKDFLLTLENMFGAICSDQSANEIFHLMLSAWGNKQSALSVLANETEIRMLDEQDLMSMQKIGQYLDNAMQKFKTTGQVQWGSFFGSITNIINTVFGEGAVNIALENYLRDNVIGLEEQLLNIPNMSLSAGTKRTEKNGREMITKSDIISNGPVTLSVEIDNQTYLVTLNMGISAKWYSSLTKTTTPKEIKIVDSTPIQPFLEGLDPSQYRGFAYNVITHEGNTGIAMRNLKQFLSASYIDEWLGGSGGNIKSIGARDIANFMMINGRLYSTRDLLAAIAKSYGQVDNIASSAVTTQFSGVSKNNKYQGDKDKPNITEGFLRSKNMIAAINQIKISSKLNGEVLKSLSKYCQPLL